MSFCVFLPASGNCYFDEEASWENGGNNGNYWSSKQNNENNAYNLYFNNEDDINVNNNNKSDNYFSCRLVRASNGQKMAPGGAFQGLFHSPQEQAQHLQPNALRARPDPQRLLPLQGYRTQEIQARALDGLHHQGSRQTGDFSRPRSGTASSITCSMPGCCRYSFPVSSMTPTPASKGAGRISERQDSKSTSGASHATTHANAGC